MKHSLARGLSALIVTLIAAMSLAFWADSASAHSALVSAAPAADATVTTPLTEVRLIFNEEPNSRVPNNTAIQVTGPNGDRVDSGEFEFDPTQKSISVSLSPTMNGLHKVVWQVVSVDGHAISGTYSFTYAAVPAPAATSTASPAPLVPTVPEVSSASDDTNNGNIPLAIALVVGITLIPIAGATILIIAWRRQRQRSGATAAAEGSPPTDDPSHHTSPDEE